jgi:hypothetical protein
MKHFKINPYLVKKGFYVSSMNWGDIPGDGFELISSDVVAGPFKTAKRAHEILESKFNTDPMEYAVHGPAKTPNGDIWYNKNYYGEIV